MPEAATNEWISLSKRERKVRVVRLSLLALAVNFALGAALAVAAHEPLVLIGPLVVWVAITVVLYQFVNHPNDGNIRSVMKWMIYVAIALIGASLFFYFALASTRE